MVIILSTLPLFFGGLGTEYLLAILFEFVKEGRRVYLVGDGLRDAADPYGR